MKPSDEDYLEAVRGRAEAEGALNAVRGELDRAIRREEQLVAELAAQRESLLSRIGRAFTDGDESEPVGDVKLSWTEADELQGVTPAQVVARAQGLAEELTPYIDEIATREGVQR